MSGDFIGQGNDSNSLFIDEPAGQLLAKVLVHKNLRNRKMGLETGKSVSLK
jgi:hypothetical protein